MPDPSIKRSDLHRAVDSLKSHLDDKFEAHLKYTEAVHKHFQEKQNKHHETLYGNGDKGIVTKVDRIETSFKNYRRVVAWLAGVFGALGGYLGITK